MGRIIRYLASMLPCPQGTRASLYRLSGVRIGSRVTIDRNVQVTRPDMVVIGSRVTICNAVSILGEVTAVHSRLEEAYDLRKTAEVVAAWRGSERVRSSSPMCRPTVSCWVSPDGS